MRRIWFPCEVSVRAARIGRSNLIVAFVHDTTERARSEDQLRKGLREKEVLLRELHHRVKNNMQIISSLFNLQTESIRDPSAIILLRECQVRIRTMALVHEKLYQAKDMSHIHFSDYLRSLAMYLFHFWQVNEERIKLDMRIANILLDVNTAIPLGLIINELLSNAIEHGFPNGRVGEIRVPSETLRVLTASERPGDCTDFGGTRRSEFGHSWGFSASCAVAPRIGVGDSPQGTPITPLVASELGTPASATPWRWNPAPLPAMGARRGSFACGDLGRRRPNPLTIRGLHSSQDETTTRCALRTRARLFRGVAGRQPTTCARDDRASARASRASPHPPRPVSRREPSRTGPSCGPDPRKTPRSPRGTGWYRRERGHPHLAGQRHALRALLRDEVRYLEAVVAGDDLGDAIDADRRRIAPKHRVQGDAGEGHVGRAALQERARPNRGDRALDFFLALGFYTRLPCPKNLDHRQLPQAAVYLPAIGWLVGALSGAAFYLAAWLWPQTAAAIIASITGILVTGAFHEDGFADVCERFRRRLRQPEPDRPVQIGCWRESSGNAPFPY